MATYDVGKFLMTWMGAWDSTSDYEILDLVWVASTSSSYIALADNTNSNPTAANSANWHVFSHGGDDLDRWVGEWAANKSPGYTVGNIVSYNDIIYFCKTDNNDASWTIANWYDSRGLKGDKGDTGADSTVPGPVASALSILEGMIAAGAITTAKLADLSVTQAKLALNAVGTSQLAPNAVNNEAMSDSSISATELNTTGTASATTYLNGNMAWASVTANLASDTTPQLGGPLDPNGHYIGRDISSAVTVTGSTLTIPTDGDYIQVGGTSTITSIVTASNRQFTIYFNDSRILTHSAFSLFLPGGVSLSVAAGDLVTFQAVGTNSVKCVDYTRENGKALVESGVADNDITTAKIADSAVTTAKINADAVTSAKVADGAVTTAKLATDAVTNTEVAENAIGVAELSATGTAGSTTYLRGDNSWSTVLSEETAPGTGLEDVLTQPAMPIMEKYSIGNVTASSTLAQLRARTVAANNETFTAPTRITSSFTPPASDNYIIKMQWFIDTGSTNGWEGMSFTAPNGIDDGLRVAAIASDKYGALGATIGEVAQTEYVGSSVTKSTTFTWPSNIRYVIIEGYFIELGGGEVASFNFSYTPTNGSATTALVINGAINGVVTADQAKKLTISNNAITSAQLANTSVGTANIYNNNITTDKLADNAVTNAKVADDAIGIAELSAAGTASATTYLRGDNSWATVSGGGGGGGVVGADIASAATITIPSTGDYFLTTGTTAITAMTVIANREFVLRFGGILTLTDNGDITLPSGASITTASGDAARFQSTSANDVTCINYMRADGTAIIGTPDASATVKGKVELSTSSENATGTATTVIPTVAGVNQIVDGRFPTLVAGNTTRVSAIQNVSTNVNADMIAFSQGSKQSGSVRITFILIRSGGTGTATAKIKKNAVTLNTYTNQTSTGSTHSADITVSPNDVITVTAGSSSNGSTTIIAGAKLKTSGVNFIPYYNNHLNKYYYTLPGGAGGAEGGTPDTPASEVDFPWPVVSATAPYNTFDGAGWYDTSTDKLKIYDGTSWVATGVDGTTSLSHMLSTTAKQVEADGGDYTAGGTTWDSLRGSRTAAQVTAGTETDALITPAIKVLSTDETWYMLAAGVAYFGQGGPTAIGMELKFQYQKSTTQDGTYGTWTDIDTCTIEEGIAFRSKLYSGSGTNSISYRDYQAFIEVPVEISTCMTGVNADDWLKIRVQTRIPHTDYPDIARRYGWYITARAEQTIEVGRGATGTRGSLNTSAITFPTTAILSGDTHIFSADVASGLTWKDTDGSTNLTAASIGDVASYDGANWVKKLNIEGPTGQGVPSGGTNGQVITKVGSNTQWATHTIPAIFNSTEQALQASVSKYTLTHNLGRAPYLVTRHLVCKTAEYGFTVGDEVSVPHEGWHNGTYIFFHAGTHDVLRADTGASATVTAANWKWIIKAW